MNQEILMALVELVKQGGFISLWGIFIYMAMGIVKLLVIWGGLCFLVKCISKAITYHSTIRHLHKVDRVSLMSEEVSSNFLSKLDEYQKESLAILKDLTKKSSESNGN